MAIDGRMAGCCPCHATQQEADLSAGFAAMGFASCGSKVGEWCRAGRGIDGLGEAMPGRAWGGGSV
jgi:hypothetical protein